MFKSCVIMIKRRQKSYANLRNKLFHYDTPTITETNGINHFQEQHRRCYIIIINQTERLLTEQKINKKTCNLYNIYQNVTQNTYLMMDPSSGEFRFEMIRKAFNEFHHKVPLRNVCPCIFRQIFIHYKFIVDTGFGEIGCGRSGMTFTKLCPATGLCGCR